MKFNKCNWLEINEIDNTTRKMKNRMSKKNQFFKIKKGKDMGVVLNKDYVCDDEQVVFMEIPTDRTYHPDWLINVEKTTTQDGSELSFYSFFSEMKEVDHWVMWGNTVEVCEGVK